MKHFYKKARLFFLFISSIVATNVFAQINEGFTTAIPLPTGWASQNLSGPTIGSTNWFQGNSGVFPSFNGAPTAYIAANFNNVAGSGTISNWLFTPEVPLANGNIISFYTRGTGSIFPDRLQLRLSTSGSSVNAGTSETSVGDFTTLLLDINSTYGTYPDTWTLFTVTLSGLSGPTTGRFAFRYFVEDGGPAGNNSDYMGIDQVTYGASCSGTPTPGNTLSTATTACPGVPFTLSLQDPGGLGITYQWQSGPSATGPWTNITGATAATYAATTSSAVFYQCVVNCGANSATSTPVGITMNPPTSCYCIPPTSTLNCTDDDVITNVTFGSSLNNTSACSTDGYGDYTSSIPATDITAGDAAPISVTTEDSWTEAVGVWIDYNHSGSFEANEFTSLGTTAAGSGGVHNGTINVPGTALTGVTRMRVRVRFSTLFTGGNACVLVTFGETEDYLVNILPCIPITVTEQPTSQSTACGQDASFHIGLAGSNPTVFWEYRTSPSANWQNVPNAAPYSDVNTATLVITNAPGSINGYQYRAVYMGGCSAFDFSNIVSLTITPLNPVVNPPSANICSGTIQQLSLTNTVSSVQTSTFTATGLPVNIPDNTFPITNALAVPIQVSGIPAGSIIQNIGIKFTLPHTWVGDVVMNLQAPNNTSLSMFALLDNASGSNGTANFTNTTIDSVSTTPISGAPAPRTGSFAAERWLITNPSFGNMVTTNSTWAALLSTINGTWNILVADLGAGDVGSVTAAELFITYTAPNFAQGVWTGPAGTIFSDAAATTPYNGTPATTVYVQPTAAGVNNYDVSFSTTTCQSSVATVPVTVNEAITGTSSVENQAACDGSSVTFTASEPSGGSTINHQWYLSTDGGATFTALSNGGNYSGVNTGSLSISSINPDMDGYLYYDSMYVSICNSVLQATPGSLTVYPNPTLVVAANPYSALFPGLTTTLSVATSPNAAESVTWMYDGSVVGTQANLPVDVDHLGEYYAVVEDVNGCMATSASYTIRDSVTATLFIYPSPAPNGQFNVRYHSITNQGGRTLNVFDSKGARVYTKIYTVFGPYTNMPVNLSNLSKGIYTVELADRSGKRIKTGRVLIP